MAVVRQRNRSPEWIQRFILNARLYQPGTTMPKYEIPLEDLEALSAYLLSLDPTRRVFQAVDRETLAELWSPGGFLGEENKMSRLNIPVIETDILILGAGGAGLCAALHAADAGKKIKILLVTKAIIGKGGCSRMVQGGYNVVLNPADSFQKHFIDTLKGGQFINNQDLAWTLVTDGPRPDQGDGDEIRLFLRPQPGRDHSPETLCRAEFRPDRSQRGPDRD